MGYNTELQRSIKEVVKEQGERMLSSSTHLNVYEKAFGIDEVTKKCSRSFSNHLGQIFEKVFDLSMCYKKVSGFGGCDGFIEDQNTAIEVKTSFNTMKASLALNEIKKKLEFAICEDYNFTLFVMNPKPGKIDGTFPLHEASSKVGVTGLTNISKIPGYDPKKHRVVSGLDVWKTVFRDDYEVAYDTLLNELKILGQSHT